MRTPLPSNSPAMLTVASVLPSETTITSYEPTSSSSRPSLRRTSRRPAPALWHGSTTESSSVDGADRAYAAWSSGAAPAPAADRCCRVVLERSHKSADGHDDGRDLLWGLVEEPYQHHLQSDRAKTKRYAFDPIATWKKTRTFTRASRPMATASRGTNSAPGKNRSPNAKETSGSRKTTRTGKAKSTSTPTPTEPKPWAASSVLPCRASAKRGKATIATAAGRNRRPGHEAARGIEAGCVGLEVVPREGDVDLGQKPEARQGEEGLGNRPVSGRVSTGRPAMPSSKGLEDRCPKQASSPEPEPWPAWRPECRGRQPPARSRRRAG